MTTFNLKDNIEDGMHPVQRYLNRARIMGVTKDRKWLLRIMSLSTFGYAKGNENINSFRLSSDKAIFKEQFFELFDIMDRKYGDLFDVQVDYSTSMRRYYFSFIVLYPKFEITNSSEHKRNITNLVVILPMIWSTDNECIYTKLLGRHRWSGTNRKPAA